MNKEELIKHARARKKYLENARDEIPFGIGKPGERDIEIYTIVIEYLESNPLAAPECSCPSGGGGLEWPCPVHPPEEMPDTKDLQFEIDHMEDVEANGEPDPGYSRMICRLKELQRRRAAMLAPQLPLVQQMPVSAAAHDVMAERQRQISVEGWSPRHDDSHNNGEMAGAAAVYALLGAEFDLKYVRKFWPWGPDSLKPSNPRHNLVKAGALILAEIERLDRTASLDGCANGDKRIVPEILKSILAELARAMHKFPTWPTDPIHASKILDEEVGELNKAVLQATYEPDKSGPDEVRDEAIQVATMAIRFIASLDKYQYTPSLQHEQGV